MEGIRKGYVEMEKIHVLISFVIKNMEKWASSYQQMELGGIKIDHRRWLFVLMEIIRYRRDTDEA